MRKELQELNQWESVMLKTKAILRQRNTEGIP